MHASCSPSLPSELPQGFGAFWPWVGPLTNGAGRENIGWWVNYRTLCLFARTRARACVCMRARDAWEYVLCFKGWESKMKEREERWMGIRSICHSQYRWKNLAIAIRLSPASWGMREKSPTAARAVGLDWISIRNAAISVVTRYVLAVPVLWAECRIFDE